MKQRKKSRLQSFNKNELNKRQQLSLKGGEARETAINRSKSSS